ncbi:hypothetical protein GCK72_015188 [Caenorhabditis remanei]|uniref:Homeobox domain-containing protein n=1 Tax=Caenorhabditis remanei TaxID=31234 RepID=A0A6A5GTC1_CAERE|nr:hypothetical protein GCK72_015188 [Caenorhabditis remanei]KAF1758728.1 hypothetical protein GCK72_015188 [Caenorhabditis remanei]
MVFDDQTADVLLQVIYALLRERPTGPYLYEASLTRLANKINKSVDYIRNWFEKTRNSDRWKHDDRWKLIFTPKEASDELNNTVTDCIEYAIECIEEIEFERNKPRAIPKDSLEEGPSEPAPKRSRLQKPEEINSNADKTLKFLYYNLLFSKNGPYLYDASLRNLAKNIGLTEEEIKNWFTEKRDSQIYAHIEIPEPIDGVTKDKFLEQVINEAILDEESLENPKPFQLPKCPSRNHLVKVLFNEYIRENVNYRNVNILDYIHTEFPKLYKGSRIILANIRFLSEKMEVSAPSIMEWFEANQKGNSSEIPVENIRMSEPLFKQMCSAEATSSGSSNEAASSSEQLTSNINASQSTSQSPIIEERNNESSVESEEQFIPDVEGQEPIQNRTDDSIQDELDHASPTLPSTVSSRFTAPNQKDSESPLEDEEDVVDFAAPSSSNKGNMEASKSSSTHDTDSNVADSERRSPDNYRISVVNEEDNLESVNNESSRDDEENGTDDVADAFLNPTPASSAHNARGGEEDVESEDPPANNRPLPEFPAAHGSSRHSEPVADMVDHPTSSAPLIPLEDGPICKVTKQVVTITRSPPCFFTDTEEWCQHCTRIYEERQKRYEELYQISQGAVFHT